MGIHQHSLSYKRLLDTLPYLVDEHTGIINSIEEQPRQENMPGLFYYIARGANTNALIASGYAATTAGVSSDRDIAICKAAGEAVERYCGSIYEDARLLLSSYSSLDGSAIHPSAFALFSPDQYTQSGFPFASFDTETPVRWTQGLDPVTGMKVWIPACFVFVPYEVIPGEASIWRAGSTGLAAHCSFEEAALNGIAEVIERDCFAITWQAMMSRPLIDRASLSKEHLELIDKFESLGYTINLVDIRNETGIPAVLGVLESNGDHGLVSIALSAAVHLNPETAVRKCLEELCLMERYTRRANLTPWDGPGENFGFVNTYFDHVKLYNSVGFKSHARFLTASAHKTRLDEMQHVETGNPVSDFEHIVRLVRESGCQVYTVDVTTEDIAALGLSVVRSIIPQYHPHLPGFTTRALGGKRLWEIPQLLGYQGLSRETGDNPFPHPFA